ncbi:Ras guanine nucleotide exchange factor F [Phytophthora cinnamomi]|uniref:Ras guanine nucleotide exchange factor F n=1 Tax=Phytophthora cinnamomi TaxID=4785 RepID=UPI00355AB332|nr:Ras guanine nucleotide exchange factor F [Phytophthora cinnamomi]
MFSSRGASQTAKGKRKAMIDIRSICLRSLVHLAIRSGPASIVLDAMSKKAQAGSFEQFAGVDTISELEYHVVSILDSVDPKGDVLGDFGIDESEKELWRIHTVFGGIELKKLKEVELNWVALISRSCLPKRTLVGFLQHRHELGDWAYPALTEEELQAREQIQQFIDQIDNDADQKDSEEQCASTTEQTANDLDNNSQPPEAGESISETSSDTRSLNLPT